MRSIKFCINYNTNEEKFMKIITAAVENIFPFIDIYIKTGWFGEAIKQRNLTAYTHEASKFSIKIACWDEDEKDTFYYNIEVSVSLGDFFCLDIRMDAIIE